MPEVSIIVVNWNGAAFLPRCLEAITAQTHQDYEIIVIDNASQDGSADGLLACWPGVRFVRLEANTGFAVANNLGARLARGQWLALVNNDAFPYPDWLENLIRAAKEHPQFSFFASRLIKAGDNNLMDGTGDVYHVSGLAWHRDHNRSSIQAHYSTEEVFSACAAAALYDREAFLEVGGFDEKYFSHHEDVDLGFRLRLRGYRCLYVPEAIVEHVGSASFGEESDLTIYQVHRNLVWAYFSDMPGSLVWRYLPAHIMANIIFLVYYTLRGQGRAIWKAKLDAMRGLPSVFRKRKLVQSARNVKIDEISQMMNHAWLSPYLLGKRSEHIMRVSRWFRLDRLL